jgi:DNA-binding LacI/PurR family transcriptional regulator
VKVPDQLSVVGFDDIPMATSTVPDLTTVQMPIAAMAAEAVSLAVGTVHDLGDGTSHADGGLPEARTRGHATVRVFPPTLVVRGSTARAS